MSAVQQTRKYVILVARDQADLREHLRKAFAADDKVRIVEASEADASKHSEKIARRLRIHGAVILRAADYEWRYASMLGVPGLVVLR
jgi:hypothetical protein